VSPPSSCPTSGTGTLYWRGTAGDPLSEINLAGTPQEEYVFFSGSRVARRDVSNGNVHYYFSDHLASASAVTHAAGNSFEEDLDYYPYGGIVATNLDTVPQNYKFTGKERDSESGLDYFGARHYASALGRFMQADPVNIKKYRLVDPQRLNLYSYTRNSPTIAIDSDGKEIIFKDVQQATQALNAARVRIAAKPTGCRVCSSIGEEPTSACRQS
jgi:RHS repeat-associated protein